MRRRRPDLYDNDPEPCPRCLTFLDQAAAGYDLETGIQEMVQPLPRLAPALARDGFGPCCPDCQTADTLHQLSNKEPMPRTLEEFVVAANTHFCPVPFTEPTEREGKGPNRSTVMTWRMLRLAVGNDRREQYRLPGVPMGLCLDGAVAVSEKGDWELHLAWLKKHGLGWEEEEE